MIAQASYSTGDMSESTLNRNFMLFYKGMNTLSTDYAIQTVAPTMAGAMIEITNLQWGFKVYDETYPLTTSTLPTC